MKVNFFNKFYIILLILCITFHCGSGDKKTFTDNPKDTKSFNEEKISDANKIETETTKQPILIIPEAKTSDIDGINKDFLDDLIKRIKAHESLKISEIIAYSEIYKLKAEADKQPNKKEAASLVRTFFENIRNNRNQKLQIIVDKHKQIAGKDYKDLHEKIIKEAETHSKNRIWIVGTQLFFASLASTLSLSSPLNNVAAGISASIATAFIGIEKAFFEEGRSKLAKKEELEALEDIFNKYEKDYSTNIVAASEAMDFYDPSLWDKSFILLENNVSALDRSLVRIITLPSRGEIDQLNKDQKEKSDELKELFNEIKKQSEMQKQKNQTKAKLKEIFNKAVDDYFKNK